MAGCIRSCAGPRFLLGGIDHPAARGWHDINLVLATALTSWQLSVEPIADSPSWRALELARRNGIAVPAEVTGRMPKGLPVRVYDLNGLLPFGQIRGVKRDTPAQVLQAEIGRVRREELKAKVLRLDADHGDNFRIGASPVRRAASLAAVLEHRRLRSPAATPDRCLRHR